MRSTGGKELPALSAARMEQVRRGRPAHYGVCESPSAMEGIAPDTQIHGDTLKGYRPAMKGFWEKYRLWVIITIAFLLIITVFSKNTVLEAMAIRRRIKVMQKEQQYYRERSKEDSTFLENLKQDWFLEKLCPRNLLYEGPAARRYTFWRNEDTDNQWAQPESHREARTFHIRKYRFRDVVRRLRRTYLVYITMYILN